MDYRFTPPGENYEAYAAGGVFYAAPGHTAFPVRLAVEIFRRCLAIRAAAGAKGPAVVYDPCCGGAYHLATLSLFNWEQIAALHASDLDPDALGLAARNLSLLTEEGLDRRIAELTALHAQYGKPSHAGALHHAQALRARLARLVAHHPLPTHLFGADATDPHAVAGGLGDTQADIVFADLPYGRGASWQAGTAALVQGADPAEALLSALQPHLAAGGVVALAAAKEEKIATAGYQRRARFPVGKRQIVILQTR
jgi:hypothetical protein